MKRILDLTAICESIEEAVSCAGGYVRCRQDGPDAIAIVKEEGPLHTSPVLYEPREGRVVLAVKDKEGRLLPRRCWEPPFCEEAHLVVHMDTATRRVASGDWGPQDVEKAGRLAFEVAGYVASDEGDSPGSDCEAVHGELELGDESLANERIDCRMMHYSQRALDDFWNFDIESLQEELDRIDPEGDLVVWHYKGKYWYVSPAVRHVEARMVHLDDEGLPEDFWTDFYAYKTGPEIEAKIEEAEAMIKSAYLELEVKSAAAIQAGLEKDASGEWFEELQARCESMDWDLKQEAYEAVLDAVEWSRVEPGRFDPWRDVDRLLDEAWSRVCDDLMARWEKEYGVKPDDEVAA